MHLALGYVVLVCHQYDVCSVYVGGYGGLSKIGSVVVMSYVNYGNYGQVV